MVEEHYPPIVYYVVARGHDPVFFDGQHGLRRALAFARFARNKMFEDVRVGAGRGIGP